ncbi:MAG: hypothetical protein ACR2JB_14910 [Bryobacteraceae bacterium]
MENDPIEELLLRAYPNPERKGCPGSDTIRALANKAIPHDDPLWQHIWKCSPCFAEFKELRDTRRLNERAVRRKRTLYWATAAGIILLCVGAALALFFLNRPKVPQQPSVANVTRPTPSYPAAVLNLEGTSTTRSAEKSATGSAVQIQTLPRRAVDLTVYLPRGSDDGEYQLEFLNSQDQTVLSAKGQANIARGLTQFTTPVNLLKIPPGTYMFRSRRVPDGMWRTSSVTIQ